MSSDLVSPALLEEIERMTRSAKEMVSCLIQLRRTLKNTQDPHYRGRDLSDLISFATMMEFTAFVISRELESKKGLKKRRKNRARKQNNTN